MELGEHHLPPWVLVFHLRIVFPPVRRVSLFPMLPCSEQEYLGKDRKGGRTKKGKKERKERRKRKEGGKEQRPALL